ncbi:MAG: hypothetical protein AAF850_12510 [Pseudomonadota bacterium]
MRGVTKLSLGDKSGEADINRAIALEPGIDSRYEAFGVNAVN